MAVAVGGMIGSLGRWAAVNGVGADRSTVTILVLNIVGSILMGGLLARREGLTDEWFALLGAGFAGGLTTFSTYAVSVAQRLEQGALLSAAANGLSTLALTLLGAGLGYRLSILAFVGRRPDPDRARPRSAGRGRRLGRLGRLGAVLTGRSGR